MKRILTMAPLLALAACATEDLQSFANGLSMAAADLDYQVNAPCPMGMQRQFVDTTIPVGGYSPYPANPYAQVGYQPNPLGSGYTYCATMVMPYYDDRRGHHDGRGDDYVDGYRDGYRDGRRDD
ncbi:MAG TPA: hypothetical protein PLN33_00265 [Hyphomonadaceae bacterium]|nr:hypothetical protein [Hyphomonadaceae bacterium]HPN04804.1 hypothetical protein [Hyphomonadaceae bacterium]